MGGIGLSYLNRYLTHTQDTHTHAHTIRTHKMHTQCTQYAHNTHTICTQSCTHNTQTQQTYMQHIHLNSTEHRYNNHAAHRTEYRIQRTEQHRCNREQRTETNTQPQQRTQHRQFEYI